MTHRGKLFGLTILLVFATGMLAFYSRFWQTTFRRSLPASTEVMEHYRDMFVDYEYLLSAKIEPKEFEAFLKAHKLHAEEKVRRIDSSESPQWWVKPRDSTPVYGQKDSDSYILVFYQDEYLYLNEGSF